MDIVDAKTATQWAREWIEQASPARAARMIRRAIESQRTCVSLCGTRLPNTAAGHRAAIAVLEIALASTGG